MGQANKTKNKASTQTNKIDFLQTCEQKGAIHGGAIAQAKLNVK
jgi:hypothetical protein